MQITTLNKIINLFLVGVLTLMIGLLLFFEQTINTLSVLVSIHGLKEAVGPLAAVLGAFVLLSFSIFLGIVIDSAAGLYVRLLIIKTILEKYSLLRRIFGIERQYMITKRLQSRFHCMLSKQRKYRNLSVCNEEDDKIYGSAIFFETAQAENINWLTQPYSVYLLSTSLILLILMIIFISPLFRILGFSITTLPLSWYIFLIPTLYFLIHAAAERRLFSYEVVYRHSLLILSAASIEENCEENVSPGGDGI